MARVTLCPNGVTASFPRSGPNARPVKRGNVNGWSRQATGRLRRWFYAVDGQALDGSGFAMTLTVRNLPPSAVEWSETRDNYVKRLRRLGLVRGQWLTEWQRRGVPHLHGCFFFPIDANVMRDDVIASWLGAAAAWRPSESAQHVEALWGLTGWLQYQAKHSVRGVQHYQRANVPQSWQEGTGRLWGKVGDWPVREEIVEVSTPAFHRFRRLMQGWLLGGARRDWSRSGERHALRRVLFLKGKLRCPDRKLSHVRALGEFCPESVSRSLLRAAEYRTPPTELVEVATGEVLSGWAGFEASCRGPVVRLGRPTSLAPRQPRERMPHGVASHVERSAHEGA